MMEGCFECEKPLLLFVAVFCTLKIHRTSTIDHRTSIIDDGRMFRMRETAVALRSGILHFENSPDIDHRSSIIEHRSSANLPPQSVRICKSTVRFRTAGVVNILVEY